jgi:hypothetical protein
VLPRRSCDVLVSERGHRSRRDLQRGVAMAAECFAHSVGTKKIPGRSIVDPLGACQVCGSFACGQHGDRQPSYPRFVCVLCVPALLTVSALSPQPGSVLWQLVEPSLLGFEDGYATVDQFVSEHPDLSWAVDVELDTATYEMHSPAASAWFEMSLEQQRLLSAAVAIVRGLQIPLEQVPAALIPFIV